MTNKIDKIQMPDGQVLELAGGLENKITNCITEIPQDIKLELNDGVLTFKAGSKVYVPSGKNPDGSNKFDEVILQENVVINWNLNRAGDIVVYNPTTGEGAINTATYSGSVAPTSGIFYNTETNLVYDIYTNHNVSGYSLPLCKFSSSSTGITNVDQVFNGFGYIGSTVFALPGVKGLIPNGRNADGSLKNIEFELDSVKTATRTWSDGNGRQVWGYIKNPPTGVTETWYYNGYIESNEEPSSNGHTMWYKPSENITYLNNETQSSTPNWEKVNYINFGIAGGINLQEVKIFTPKTSFHAVDRNDSSWLSGLGMPSNKYIDLTLGASGSTYTAPANGWFTLTKKGNQGEYGELFTLGTTIESSSVIGGNGNWVRVSIPCRKNQNIVAYYTASGDVVEFIFIYAEGEV